MASRGDVEVISADAKRLLEDPAFVRGYDNLRGELIRNLEDLKHDGSSAADDFEREVCRSLRTLQNLRRSIALGGQIEALRLKQKEAAEAAEPDTKDES